jgi:hypothetical protein
VCGASGRVTLTTITVDEPIVRPNTEGDGRLAGVAELARLVGLEADSGGVYDWPTIESSLGRQLPHDYKAVVERFPRGFFQGVVRPIRPGEYGESDSEFLGYYAHRLDDLHHWRSGHPSAVPAPIWPEAGGLLPWGVARNSALAFWRTDHADPDQWSIMVTDRDFDTWVSYDGGVVDFLTDVVLGRFHYGRLGVDVLPGDPFLELPPQRPAGQGRQPEGISFWSNRNPTGAVPRHDSGGLAKLVGFANRRVRVVDWGPAESRLGVSLPSDYKAFIEAFGPGTFGDIRIAAPDSAGGGLFALWERTAAVAAGRHRREAEGPVFPAPGGMIPWGGTADGWTFCWAPVGTDPDVWGVVCAMPELRGFEYRPNLGFSSFLLEYADPDRPFDPLTLRETPGKWDRLFISQN